MSDINSELTWRNLTLTQYENNFFEFVYNCYQDYNSRCLYTNDFIIISKNEFRDYMNKRATKEFHDFMIILNTATNSPIGFIYTYNFNRQNDYIYFSIYIKEESRNNANLATAGIIFFNYMFKYYPLRKIYCSVFDYNSGYENILKNAGFNLEGELKEYRYYNKKYNDMKIYSLFRRDFCKLKEKLNY